MEIKARLDKPYTDKQRCDFIVKNNHKLDYEIQETTEALLAIYNEPTIEEKEKDVRNVRNHYLEKYVDPYQMVIRWNNLTEENQNNIINYRQYLLDYTISSDKWFEQNPMTYDAWLLTI